MTDFAVLDLFAGLGGFSQGFKASDRWSVTTVDIDERFEPTRVADVFDLRPSDFDRGFDVVLASPPCDQFSFAASRYERMVDGEPQTDDARDAVGLVYHTLGLVQGLTPDYWFVENPQGWLRQVIGEPTGRVTYCQYGTEMMKPTDLWGDHPASLSYRACAYGDSCHGGQGNCRDEWRDEMADKIRDPAERAKVPAPLSESIRDACEAGLAGDTHQQVTLAGADR